MWKYRLIEGVIKLMTVSISQKWQNEIGQWEKWRLRNDLKRLRMKRRRLLLHFVAPLTDISTTILPHPCGFLYGHAHIRNRSSFCVPGVVEVSCFIQQITTNKRIFIILYRLFTNSRTKIRILRPNRFYEDLLRRKNYFQINAPRTQAWIARSDTTSSFEKRENEKKKRKNGEKKRDPGPLRNFPIGIGIGWPARGGAVGVKGAQGPGK